MSVNPALQPISGNYIDTYTFGKDSVVFILSYSVPVGDGTFSESATVTLGGHLTITELSVDADLEPVSQQFDSSTPSLTLTTPSINNCYITAAVQYTAPTAGSSPTNGSVAVSQVALMKEGSGSTGPKAIHSIDLDATVISWTAAGTLVSS